MNIKILLLKTLVSSYATMTVQAKDMSGELWYEQAKVVTKYFSKRKPEGVSNLSQIWLDKKFDDIKDLDATYFTDKKFSSYVAMILLIDYLIRELNDIEMRSKFLYFNTKSIVDELDETDWIRDVGVDTQKYITKVIELIGL